MNCGFDNWDLTPFFSGIKGQDFTDYLNAVKKHLEIMLTETAPKLSSPKAASKVSLDEAASVINEYERLEAEILHLCCYTECSRSEDLSNDAAASAQEQTDLLASSLRRLEAAILAYIGSLSDEGFDSLISMDSLISAAYKLRRMRRDAKFSMKPELEDLAAELEVTGFRAWENLYENIAGSLNFEIEDSQGNRRRVPMSLKVSLMEDPDAKVRAEALKNSNLAWKGAGESVAAALNSISGHRLKLQERRGLKHFLDQAAFESGLKRSTLETMMDTVASEFELPRAILRRKAALLGMERLHFSDIYAPVDFTALTGESAKSDRVYTWEEACRTVEAAFSRFDPDFGKFAHDALQAHWVESEVREGKRPGGFCISSTVIGQSRIFMTFQGNLGDVFTLAHELGHAYHEHVMGGMRPFCHYYPMTLAETASTFAEALLIDYLLSVPDLSRAEKLSLCQRRLDDAASYLLNIPMRYMFEREYYVRRASGALSAGDLCSLMEKTQREVYGDALDPQHLDPWFWASKGHFYITEVSFYNFPYTFGYLFSMGVYARAIKEGEAFRSKLRRLLCLTGSASCEDTARLGIGADLGSPEFWQESLSIIKRDFSAFEELLKA